MLRRILIVLTTTFFAELGFALPINSFSKFAEKNDFKEPVHRSLPNDGNRFNRAVDYFPADVS